MAMENYYLIMEKNMSVNLRWIKGQDMENIIGKTKYIKDIGKTANNMEKDK